jgi:hypothetical protein
MKKNLLILLLLIPFLGMSQTKRPIEGFLGIKFGSSKADVIAAIEAKGGKLEHYDKTPENQVYFSNVKLGPRATIIFFVVFNNDKAYEAIFGFKPDSEPQAVEYYDALISDISDIYGKGKSTRTFKSPYEDGDGHAVSAIQGGYAQYFTNWEADKKIIQININQELNIQLTYEDETLAAEAKAKQKAKEKSDY